MCQIFASRGFAALFHSQTVHHSVLVKCEAKLSLSSTTLVKFYTKVLYHMHSYGLVTRVQ